MRLARLVLLAALLVGCKRTPMGRVERIRDELAGDAPRFGSSLASCGAARAACAADVARSIGGTFDDKKPDQISAAAVAVVVARDRRGSDVPAPDVWIAAMRKARGPGADALRLAVALDMARVADRHAHAIDADADARSLLADVASALPGACKTYELLGAGAVPDAMAIVDSPDHSACVQRDLSRRTGPGAGYGQGLFRGAAGAFALWNETLAALHDGASLTDAPSRGALAGRLRTVDAATRKITLKVVAAPAGNTWGGPMATEHDAPLGSDAGARAPPSLKK